MKRILLDTSVLWVVIHSDSSVLGRAIGDLFLTLRLYGYVVLYSVASVEELWVVFPGVSEDSLRLITLVASESGIRIDELRRRIGRYDKWVKRLGSHDVMIAVNAFMENAVLATGDWGQARLFMSISGLKPLFIPFKQLSSNGGK